MSKYNQVDISKLESKAASLRAARDDLVLAHVPFTGIPEVRVPPDLIASKLKEGQMYIRNTTTSCDDTTIWSIL